MPNDEDIFKLPEDMKIEYVDGFGHDYDQEISFIAIQRTGCFGKCPTYELIFYNDGIVKYKGHGNVERVGEHYGKLEKYIYTKLAKFIKENNIINLKDAYMSGTEDASSCYVSFQQKGKKKVIFDDGGDFSHNACPINLWVLRKLIDDAYDLVEWNDEDNENEDNKITWWQY